jgi:hypothetical protein
VIIVSRMKHGSSALQSPFTSPKFRASVEDALRKRKLLLFLANHETLNNQPSGL